MMSSIWWTCESMKIAKRLSRDATMCLTLQLIWVVSLLCSPLHSLCSDVVLSSYAYWTADVPRIAGLHAIFRKHLTLCRHGLHSEQPLCHHVQQHHDQLQYDGSVTY